MVNRPLQNLFAIYAGLEPESFIELFPYWVVQEDITDMQIDVRFHLWFKIFQKIFFLKIGILVNSHFLWVAIPMNWFPCMLKTGNTTLYQNWKTLEL